MKQNTPGDRDSLRDAYDFSGGVRGKHHEAYRRGTNAVLVDPDVAEVFKDSAPPRRIATARPPPIGS